MSPKMYEIGKKRTPAPKANGIQSGCTIFAGPIRFEQMRIVTNAAITNS
jgi:hypothetical protein